MKINDNFQFIAVTQQLCFPYDCPFEHHNDRYQYEKAALTIQAGYVKRDIMQL